METTYFTCTLGQAALIPKDPSTAHAFSTIPNFIRWQASRIPSQPAVGFYRPGSDRSAEWDHHVFTFADIDRIASRVAKLLLDSTDGKLEKRQTVALVCPSSAEFLFMWLALMRLGHGVLLLAPQCQPKAVAALCKACHVDLLFYDEVYRKLADESVALVSEEGGEHALTVMQLPFTDEQSVFTSQDAEAELPEVGIDSMDVAYLHHTSGTSTGTPKPIPQTHRAGLGVLPCIPTEQMDLKATFTTTPLYHGGIADLFRAWSSGALIWLFPGKEVPITAANIIKCLDITKHASADDNLSPVRYFSSVPYVLQMMEADKRGLEYLSAMDIVGVGGAALPAEVGDRLVDKGVNLISRFGSAECGFLMSSHRNYNKDKAWNFLRSDRGAEKLRFEERDGGLAELVILDGWPHMAKRNRDDGSYATSDLFAPHPSISNAWRYHSRADSQLTLITGKKFDPAPLEDAISASSSVQDALIFGNGQQYPGVLLFRSAQSESMGDEEFIKELTPIIEKLNNESQSHARIPRGMLIPMSYVESPLEKSSKGTVMRGQAEERYAQVIEQAYFGADTEVAEDIPDDEVQTRIVKLVEGAATGKEELTPETDLFAYGVDSVAGVQVRYGIRRMLPPDRRDLPLNIVEDCGNVKRLADFVLKSRRGEAYVENDDEEALMRELVEEYGSFPDGVEEEHSALINGTTPAEDGNVVLLTGATGALGAHVLDVYHASPDTRKIYCLVRGASSHAAEERVRKALAQRGLLDAGQTDTFKKKVVVLTAQLGDKNLGLSDETYVKLLEEVTTIVHLAWSVNFRMRLRSFVKDNIAGVRHLLDFARSSKRSAPPCFAFCSSVASTTGLPPSATPVPERIMTDPASASPLGYARSKWVAESICDRANQDARLKGRIGVFRVGQLAGDSTTGVWNTKEAWPLMLSSVRLTGTLPAIEGEPLNWLPVNLAAESFAQGVDAMGRRQCTGKTPVFHVVNEHQHPVWTDLLEWLKKHEQFEAVAPSEWVEKLELKKQEYSEKGEAEHPALKLLGLWKEAYGKKNERESKEIETSTLQAEHFANGITFDMRKTKKDIPVLEKTKPVDEAYFDKIWTWLTSAMLEAASTSK